MKWFERLRAAISILGGSSKALDVQAWLRGDDAESDAGAALTSSYQQSTWVYACIRAIAEQIAQIPVVISRGEFSPRNFRNGAWRRRAMGEDIVSSGPLVELLNQPHPQMNRFDFWSSAVSWLMLRGDAFVVATDADLAATPLRKGCFRQTRSGAPKQLVILNPERTREIVDANRLQGWSFTGSKLDPMPSIDLLPEEVLFSRIATPYNFWRGMSPLSVARLAAETDYASAQFMKGLMLNNADTGVIAYTDLQASPEQREQILAALRARKRKAGTADRPLFLWGGTRIEKPSISSADMQFLENRKFSRQEICAIFHVPQEVLGFTEDANRSVSDAARLNFIEFAVLPVTDLLEAAFTPLARAFNPAYYLWFDVDNLPVMERARRDRFTAASTAMTTMGVPLNVLNERFDLGLPSDLPHGAKVFLPFSLQEYGQEAPQPEPPFVPPEEEEEPTSSGTEVEQDIFSRARALLAPHVCAPNPEYEASIAGSVKIKKGRLTKFFFEQRGRVLAALPDALKKAPKDLEVMASSVILPALASILAIRTIDDVFNSGAENERLKAKLKPLLIADLEFGGAQLWKEIGLSDFQLSPSAALDFIGRRQKMIEDINATTWKKLKIELQQGVGAGESYNQIADRVKAVFAAASQERAETIALTETNVAVNTGRHEGMVAAKVQRKGWQTSRLESTRPSHLANESLSNQENGIPMDAIWPNGCRYPGDPEGAPGETINCRCFGFAIVGKKNDQPLLTFEQYAAATTGKR